MNELKVGDVVRLKTGGPRMTVNEIELEGSKDVVATVWFEPRLSAADTAAAGWEGPFSGEFAFQTLEKVP